jgi:hypothetical protein
MPPRRERHRSGSALWPVSKGGSMIFSIVGSRLSDVVDLLNVAEEFDLQLLDITYNTANYAIFYQTHADFPMEDFHKAICCLEKKGREFVILLKNREYYRD